MSQAPSDPPRALPRWLVVAGSVAIGVHLLAVAALVLAAPSGPWFVPQLGGPDMGMAPKFAEAVNDVTAPNYLAHVKLVHNYHFPSNRLDQQAGASFTVRLKDSGGTVFKTLQFPDENASPWVRGHQQLLARALAVDMPLPPPQAPKLAAAGKKARKVSVWEPQDERGVRLQLRTVEEPQLHHILHKLREEKKLPPEGNLLRPTDWVLLLADSYARHLCREHGAARVELIRHSQMPLSPAVLVLPEQAGQQQQQFIPPVTESNFGDLPR